jgi:flagellar hook-length control protein FliK
MANNKFIKLISDNGNGTLIRAETISTAAEVAQQNIVNQLKQQKSQLEMKVINLTDFAPETTDSLRPGDKDWDAAKWAKELQETKEQLYDINIQLKIAEDTYNEFFKEIQQ